MSVALRRGSVDFVGGAGHGLKTSMYGKKSCFIIVSLEVLIHGSCAKLICSARTATFGTRLKILHQVRINPGSWEAPPLAEHIREHVTHLGTTLARMVLKATVVSLRSLLLL